MLESDLLPFSYLVRSTMEKGEKQEQAIGYFGEYSEDPTIEAPINASGHLQELDRNFSLLSLCGLAVTTGNTWLALGGSIVWLPP